jgi:hypothetical protein
MMPSFARDSYHAQLLMSKVPSAYQVSITKSLSDMSTSRELPMPIVSRIVSLNQAAATLQHCLGRLTRVWNGSPIDDNERRHFQLWLEQWEQAFTAFLSYSMSAMPADDITRCRIIKSNHLACTVLAGESDTNPSSFDRYETEFKAIVDLAEAILRSRHEAGSSAASATTGALDVQDPLRVVGARCTNSTIRGKALQLLSIVSAR